MDTLSFIFAIVSLIFGILVASMPWPRCLGMVFFSCLTGWFTFQSYAWDRGLFGRLSRYVLIFGGVKWTEEDFCRGWEIDGRTGSGKTASGVVPIIYEVKKNRPTMGILALDTKGDLSEPVAAIARELKCEKELRQLEVRPDDAPLDWHPSFTMNLLGDPSIPPATYAKMLVDVATAAGQKGGQAFFKNAAQTAIQNCFGLLTLSGMPVTLDNIYNLISDENTLKGQIAKLKILPGAEPALLVQFWDDYFKQPAEQLGGVRSTVFNYLQPYLAPDIVEVFCSVDPTFDIKEIDEGKLITVKVPQKYQTEKKYISLLLKTLFYLHALRRYDLTAQERAAKNLIVMVLDEAQETVLVSEDGISDYNVIDKIRGARATTINSTQSPTSYIPPMGNREKADVFLLNLGNKIYFTAADKLASEMIADAIGKRTIKKKTWGRSAGRGNVSWTEQDEYFIKPHILRSLPKHTAIIKHCEQSYKKVRLSPTPFTQPQPKEKSNQSI